ncbi:MAG: three-Cys-motif partner protein TcmP [Acidobacteria bacterium]|nr:three-Cys-motif partner protein TcmP [Acidobacteriota bacterium]
MFVSTGGTPVSRYGGDWTERKLEALRKYLEAYMTIFTKNQWAKRYHTIYFDAFAGCGYRSKKKRKAPEKKASSECLFLDGIELAEADEFRKGSPAVALSIPNPFGSYVFNDISPSAIRGLEELRSQFPLLADRITLMSSEANRSVIDFCASTDWKKNRAVLFLDPFGMQVEWATLEKVAITEAIDLWLLFPLGQSVVRMLTKDEAPPDDWATCLTKLFGTDEWRTTFYSRESDQGDLFDTSGPERRCCSLQDIERYFIGRLKSIFKGVVEKPMYLRNSKEVPLFLLCFAAGNERGSMTAIKMASDIMGKL